LNAQSSAAANGHTISTYQWTNVGNQTVTIQNATSATATVTAPSCGYATVQLAVTDEIGRVDTANVVLSPTSATSAAPASATGKSCTIVTPKVVLAVCPVASSVAVGSGSQTFTATVANTTDDSVTWQVNGIAGGDSNVGTITAAGVYTAPAHVPSGSAVAITAVSNADHSVVSTSIVNITSPGSHGGGAMDSFTLLGEALALGAALRSRYARRCAASSQDFCARR
jgi:hypothetical protein